MQLIGQMSQWQCFFRHAERMAWQPGEHELEESKKNEILFHKWRHNWYGRALWGKSQDWIIGMEQSLVQQALSVEKKDKCP